MWFVGWQRKINERLNLIDVSTLLLLNMGFQGEGDNSHYLKVFELSVECMYIFLTSADKSGHCKRKCTY